jgi:hypothetical protein
LRVRILPGVPTRRENHAIANNYCQCSSFLSIPKHDLDRARKIVDRVTDDLKWENDYCGCRAVIDDADSDTGVWFYDEECIEPTHVEKIARTLINELEIDKPFYCSWAFSCSKPRVDEFGGGAFVIVRGYETYYVDAQDHVRQAGSNGLLKPENP